VPLARGASEKEVDFSRQLGDALVGDQRSPIAEPSLVAVPLYTVLFEEVFDGALVRTATMELGPMVVPVDVNCVRVCVDRKHAGESVTEFLTGLLHALGKTARPTEEFGGSYDPILGSLQGGGNAFQVLVPPVGEF
tara:strand:- start:1330 stop:1737 length:408 start_codon:yes stop_codon:yes gene_type:complete